MDSCGAGGEHLGGIWPHDGGKDEWTWTAFHRLGFRNLVSPLTHIVPAYRHMLFYAEPASGNHARRRLALTIDDAVSRRNNANVDLSRFENLLDVLKAQGVTALFFVIADAATMSAEGRRLLRRALAEGHEFGNHGLMDGFMTGMSAEDFAASLDTWEARLREVLGRWPARDADRKWFRPARGLVGAAMAGVLAERGYLLSLPDVWSADCSIIDVGFHARVLANAPCDGSVLLMHSPDDSWGSQITEVLPQVVPILQEGGFEFARMSEMFAEALPPSPWRLALATAVLAAALLAPACLACALLCCCGSAAQRARGRCKEAREARGEAILAEPRLSGGPGRPAEDSGEDPRGVKKPGNAAASAVIELSEAEDDPLAPRLA